MGAFKHQLQPDSCFDRWASRYDFGLLQRLLFDPIHAAVVEAWPEPAAPPSQVLDLGCGTGRLLERAGRRWPTARCVGLDLSQPMLDQARARFQGQPRFELVQGDSASLPFAAESFDAVLSTASLHHWSDAAAGLAEARRVLKPLGRLILADFDLPWAALLVPLMNRLDHARFRSLPELRSLLLAAGLRLESERRLRAVAPVQVFVAARTP